MLHRGCLVITSCAHNMLTVHLQSYTSPNLGVISSHVSATKRSVVLTGHHATPQAQYYNQYQVLMNPPFFSMLCSMTAHFVAAHRAWE
jgi:hypothetical protein